MKLSARNQIKGKVVSVKKGATTSHVKIDIGNGVLLTSAITNEAVAELKLKKGDTAWCGGSEVRIILCGESEMRTSEPKPHDQYVASVLRFRSSQNEGAAQ